MYSNATSKSYSIYQLYTLFLSNRRKFILVLWKFLTHVHSRSIILCSCILIALFCFLILIYIMLNVNTSCLCIFRWIFSFFFLDNYWNRLKLWRFSFYHHFVALRRSSFIMSRHCTHHFHNLYKNLCISWKYLFFS